MIAGEAREADTVILDEGVLDGLASLLGDERIGELLLSFGQEARHRLALIEAAQADPGGIVGHAHVLTSIAGQLGFAQLSRLCSRIEAELLGGDRGDRVETPRATGPQVAGLRLVVERALDAAARSRYAATGRAGPPGGSAA